MKKVEIYKLNNYYGVMEDGVPVVPNTHTTPNSAIDEWAHFHMVNNGNLFEGKNKEFLGKGTILTDEQINQIKLKTLNDTSTTTTRGSRVEG